MEFGALFVKADSTAHAVLLRAGSARHFLACVDADTSCLASLRVGFVYEPALETVCVAGEQTARLHGMRTTFVSVIPSNLTGGPLQDAVSTILHAHDANGTNVLMAGWESRLRARDSTARQRPYLAAVLVQQVGHQMRHQPALFSTA